MLERCTKEKAILWLGLLISTASIEVFRAANVGNLSRDSFSAKYIAAYDKLLLGDSEIESLNDDVMRTMFSVIGTDRGRLKKWKSVVSNLEEFYAGTCCLFELGHFH